MNSIFQNIILQFTTVDIDERNIRESYDEVKLQIHCSTGKVPSEEDFNVALNDLSTRDNLHVSILQDGEIVENYHKSSSPNFTDFINECQTCIDGGDFEIVLTITKQNVNQIISVYYPDQFIDYLSKLSLNFFFDDICYPLLI